MEALNERSLEIVARSAVQLNKRDCLILWFPTSVEDESLAEWFDATMQLLIAEVEPKYLNPKYLKLIVELLKILQKKNRWHRTVQEEHHSPEEAQEKGENSDSEVEKKDDSGENTKSEIDPEESEYQTIEFRLVADPDEKDALIKQLQEPEEEEEEEDEGEHEEGGGETDAEEKAEEEDGEQAEHHEEEETADKEEEEQHEEPPPNENQEESAVEQVTEAETAD